MLDQGPKQGWAAVERWPPVGIVAGAVGGAAASWLMYVLSDLAAIQLMLVPFATSILLVMGTPEAAPAQPRALIGGHLVSTLVGIAVLYVAGSSPPAAAVAVGLAMLAMHLTRSFHPPAGIDPFIVVHYATPWTYLLMPVLAGVLLLAAFAFIWHNLWRRGTWPRQWW